MNNVSWSAIICVSPPPRERFDDGRPWPLDENQEPLQLHGDNPWVMCEVA